MNIFYVNVIEQNAGWGAEFFMNRAFLQNGHRTNTLDYRKHRGHLAREFFNVPPFDVFFLQRGDYFPIPLIQAVNRPRFFWASELVARCRDQDQLLSCGLFSHIFVRTNDCINTIVQNRWAERSRLSVLLSAFDQSQHRRMQGTEKDIDVLFVGTMTDRRQRMITEAKKHFDVIEAKAFGLEMAELFNRAKVVLNIHAENHLDTETRVFEVLGSGAFLLSERLSGDNPFTAGVHYAEFDGIEDFLDKIRYYLQNASERENLEEAGYQEAQRKHSYLVRAKEVAEVFSQHLAADAKPHINRYSVRWYQVMRLCKRVSNKIKRTLAR